VGIDPKPGSSSDCKLLEPQSSSTVIIIEWNCGMSCMCQSLSMRCRIFFSECKGNFVCESGQTGRVVEGL